MPEDKLARATARQSVEKSPSETATVFTAKERSAMADPAPFGQPIHLRSAREIVR
jgi:hypothetical protein